MHSPTFSGNPTFTNCTFSVQIFNGPQPYDVVKTGVQDLGETVEVSEVAEAIYKAHEDDPSIYKIIQRPKGRVLLINNQFKSSKKLERTGSLKDVLVMSELWIKIGCHVRIENDLTAEDIHNTVADFVKDSAAEFIVIVIMSHGEQDDFIWGDDKGKAEVQKIVDHVGKSTAGKPKLLFFQMCRGEKYSTVHADAGGMDSDDTAWVEKLVDEVLPGGRVLGSNSGIDVPDLPAREQIDGKKDILLAFGTMPDHISFRNTETGSWFIQSIAEVFADGAHKDDVVKMMESVKNNVKMRKVDKLKSRYYGCVASVDGADTFGGRKLFLFPGFPRTRANVTNQTYEDFHGSSQHSQQEPTASTHSSPTLHEDSAVQRYGRAFAANQAKQNDDPRKRKKHHMALPEYSSE